MSQENIVIKVFRRFGALLWRVRRKLDKELIHLLLPLISPPIKSDIDLVRLGTDYGGWHVPTLLMKADSICYCVGVGADASFDFCLVSEFGARVFSFDPTPRAIEYMKSSEYNSEKLHFFPVGVWDENTELRFYSPANKEQTSHSAFDLHGTNDYFTAQCKKLSTIMSELGHSHIDLLKLDIEGAWRNVIQNLIEERIKVSILCVELDSPVSLLRVLKVIRSLKDLGFQFIHVEKDNYLFIHNALISE
ncbi:MAG: hypothetical protein CO186_05590 [Zetaproteobacteria bacterium CG_4_9_14_3_um_filter_49_83]|nr:MAG: hypothetical protein AUJ56_01220 [Zetaproteobacteria bacterium CG1_02_49_23]PIQ33830.1 MAG: hypothetical protein COW62_04115 [Zetaproteobacteria bacterium CG17_big_fil_post_rev_8_21_14_2_50_50_13]PIV30338.1 MAG: hypothetical protein COS35_07150 [Zetaproteobacteria bacterium CG02_land_8_20_14_3_00_50_9]PIY55578.1 MAG: hypothetical protein COZ00_08660 [Zetaproteobacteria bacterium CG_4_10_14_0_8_um_filter_49_80]PJA35470.1 MAG: hypothetical protein CO186_05590 [Zetaproteobacteria bacterium